MTLKKHVGQSLLISLIGTSKLRPLRIINEKKPDRIYLITNNQTDWAISTKHLADEIANECDILYDDDDIIIHASNLTDFDEVFSLVYRLIEQFKHSVKGKNPVYIDVSATTGIAMSAAILSSCLFKDVHLYYLYAKFKPGSILSILEEEERKSTDIGRQPLMEIPKPLVPIRKMDKNGTYYDILTTLRDELGGSTKSQNELVNKIKVRDKNGDFVRDDKGGIKTLAQIKTKSTPVKYSRHIVQLERWGLVERQNEIGAANQITLTDFGRSLLKAIESDDGK